MPCCSNEWNSAFLLTIPCETFAPAILQASVSILQASKMLIKLLHFFNDRASTFLISYNHQRDTSFFDNRDEIFPSKSFALYPVTYAPLLHISCEGKHIFLYRLILGNLVVLKMDPILINRFSLRREGVLRRAYPEKNCDHRKINRKKILHYLFSLKRNHFIISKVCYIISHLASLLWSLYNGLVEYK